MTTRQLIIYFSMTIHFAMVACTSHTDQGPSPAQTPAEEQTSFQISPGLKIELVAAEPMIQDPVVITFDEDGRLWVVEMRGFMPDIEGNGEKDKTGRISILEDKDGDGQMETHTIYLDSLIMPRALALVKGGALVAENEALWLTQDVDGDLRADTKILIDSAYAGGALPEHSGNGLWRGIDNWYYNVKSRLRYHLVNGEWKRDSTEFRGQWGLSHDDEGRLIYNYNWSQLHADLVPPDYFSGNKNHTTTTGIDHGLTTDRRIYPIRSNLAVNRGYVPGTLDEESRLIEFTAACAPYYYRGTTLPDDYYGNAFVCEPSGNLIKRNVTKENGVYISAHDPSPGIEFLASTDERFRPVFLTSGPDGALYIADMYRGLIQHGAYITPYLKETTLSRKLDKPVHCGRIWRIVPTTWKPSKPDRLSAASIEALITNLSHSNGWTRDVTQRLLIERNDPGSIPLLKEAALNNKNYLSRFHSLWTLEGLKAHNPDFLFRTLQDSNVLIRITSLRLLEPFAMADEKVRLKLQQELPRMFEHATSKEILQMALTARVLNQVAAIKLLSQITDRYDTSALIRDAVLSSLQDNEFSFLQNQQTNPEWKIYKPSREILTEMLTVAIIRKRNPEELSVLLNQLDERHASWQSNVILNAMTIQGNKSGVKPIKLTAPPKVITNTNPIIDSLEFEILSSMFEWPGHLAKSPAIMKSTGLTEDQLRQVALGRQHYLTTCAGCHGTDGEGLTRFAPTLVGSDWVVGDERRLTLIVLHGMEGLIQVNGKSYDVPEILPVMPAHTPLDDEKITNIIMYIRNAWGNQAGPINRRTVGLIRNRAQGRVQPWTVSELEKYVGQMEVQK